MYKASVLLLLLLSIKGFSQFTSGNLVIYRVGDGKASLTIGGTPVFLDEYSPTGTLVRSIPMPVKATGNNKPLISSGTALTEGYLNRSADKQFLTLTGYAQEPGDPSRIATTTAVTVNRVVGIVDYAGNINTTTALTDYANGSSPRSVVSDDGINLWLTGASGGLRYTTAGATTSRSISTAIDNLRIVSIFDNQLYSSIGTTTATRVGAISTGLPVTGGQAIRNLPGLPNTGSPFQYVMFDQNPSIPGMDVLYVADEDSAVFKYSLNAVSNQWVSNGAIGTRFDYYRGLTGTVVGNEVFLYAVRKGGTIKSGSGGELVLLRDGSGYNGTFAPIPVVIATAAANTGFRGVAFAPEQKRLIENIILPVQFDAVKAVATPAGIQVSFTNKVESDVLNYSIERSYTGRAFESVTTLYPKLNNGSEANYTWTDNFNKGDVVFYRIKGEEISGKILYSPIVKVSVSTTKELTIFPNPVQGSQLVWSAGLTAGVYQLRIFNNSGQVVWQQALTHAGGTTSQTIYLPATVKNGRFTLQITGGGAHYAKSFLVQ